MLIRRVQLSRDDAVRALDELRASRQRVDAGPFGRESACHGETDAARCADHGRDAALELHDESGERNVLSCAVGPAASVANASGPASSGRVPASSPSETLPLLRSSSAAAKFASV